MTEFHWLNARHSVVRELGWSVFSDPISHFQDDTQIAPWRPRWDEEAEFLLAMLDENPAPLVDYLEDLRDRRLGARFEALWHYFLSRHSFYEVLAANLQISHGDYTLGALDFLLRDGYSSRVVHLELAVKFYLYYPVPSADELSRWIGPNPDDNLARKLHHMEAQQLPLSKREEVIGYLKAHDYPVPTLRTALAMGYLFAPLGQEVRPVEPVNATCLKGQWLYGHQLDSMAQTHSGKRWVVVNKDAWLDPFPEIGNAPESAFQTASALLLKSGQPVMLATSDRENTIERFFVVPENWPI